MQLESQQEATKQHPLSSVSSPLPRSRSRLTTHTTPHWAHGCTILREETYESWWWRNGHGAYDCSTQDLNVVDGHDFLSHENFLDTPLDVYFVKRCTLDSSRLCSASAWQPANISLSKRDKWKLDKIHNLPLTCLPLLDHDVTWCDVVWLAYLLWSTWSLEHVLKCKEVYVICDGNVCGCMEGCDRLAWRWRLSKESFWPCHWDYSEITLRETEKSVRCR